MKGSNWSRLYRSILMDWQWSRVLDVSLPSKKIPTRGSNPKSIGHLGGRRELAVTPLVITLDLLGLYTVLHKSQLQGHDPQSLVDVGSSTYGPSPSHCTLVSGM